MLIQQQGFEAIKQLLQQAQPYRFILGVRDTKRTQAAYDGISYDTQKHKLTLLPVELADLRTVKTFARQTLDTLGDDKLDYLMLNAGMNKAADQPGVNGSKWCEAYVVNHLSQHYLVHLLRDKLVASKSRMVVVSSGAIRNVSDPSTLDAILKAQSGSDFWQVYAASKFAQLLGAHYWRRHLPEVTTVAVSPGMIPGTNLGRHLPSLDFPESVMKDAKPLDVGAQSMLAAFTRDDLPEDPDRIFLTSWGEWWEKDVFAPSLDKALQDKWSPSKEDIEREELTT